LSQSQSSQHKTFVIAIHIGTNKAPPVLSEIPRDEAYVDAAAGWGVANNGEYSFDLFLHFLFHTKNPIPTAARNKNAAPPMRTIMMVLSPPEERINEKE
jgi:hypothetical protein